MSTVTIKIAAMGKINSIETDGFSGETCKNVTQGLEQALESQVNSSETEFKGEYYENTDGSIHEEEYEKW